MTIGKKYSIRELFDILNRFSEGSENWNKWNDLLNQKISLIKLLNNSDAVYSDEIITELLGDDKAFKSIFKFLNISDTVSSLKSLLLDGVNFVLNIDGTTKKNLKYWYFLGLFDSLKIDINDKKFFSILKDELEKQLPLPESPLDCILGYNLNRGFICSNSNG